MKQSDAFPSLSMSVVVYIILKVWWKVVGENPQLSIF